MNIPNLAAELAYWRPRLGLQDWAITMRYEANPQPPDDPTARVWGYCDRNTDVMPPTADIVIRTPTSDADCLEALDTIAHELLHCLHAAAAAPVAEEEKIVWTLAPLLTQLRLTEPSRAQSLCKAMSMMKAPRAARKGMTMDPAQLAALALKAGEMMATLTIPDEFKAILQELIAMAAGGTGTPVPVTEEPPKTDEGTPPAQPPLGTDKPAEKAPMYKPTTASVATKTPDPVLAKIQQDRDDDRGAAADAVLDVHPHLSPEQRARLRETGVEKGIAVLRKDLALFAPAPVAKVEALPNKLGLPAAPRGGSSGAGKIERSGNPVLAKLFRVRNDDANHDGVEVPSDGSALVTFSVVDAFAQVRQKALAKAFGGAKGGAK